MLCSIASALPRGQDDFAMILTGFVLGEASSFKGEALEMQTENINNNTSSKVDSSAALSSQLRT